VTAPAGKEQPGTRTLFWRGGMEKVDDAAGLSAEIPQRIKFVKGSAVPLYPDECEPHTPSPDGYLAWDAWAEEKSQAHDQRQCRGCGLWAVWEPKL
jgi:hypothetical protein